MLHFVFLPRIGVNFLWRNGNAYISRARAQNFLDADGNRSARETTADYEEAARGQMDMPRTNGYCCALLTLDKNYSSLNLPEHHNTALNEHYRELLIGDRNILRVKGVPFVVYLAKRTVLNYNIIISKKRNCSSVLDNSYALCEHDFCLFTVFNYHFVIYSSATTLHSFYFELCNPFPCPVLSRPLKFTR